MGIKWRIKRGQSWGVTLKGKQTEKEHFGIKAVCWVCKASLVFSTTSLVKYVTITNVFGTILGGNGENEMLVLVPSKSCTVKNSSEPFLGPGYIWVHLFIWWRKPFPISLYLCLDIWFFLPTHFPQFLTPDTLLPQFLYHPTCTPNSHAPLILSPNSLVFPFSLSKMPTQLSPIYTLS